jgi:hypothetical protein
MAQKTIVSGKVVDESSKEGIANVKIQFFNSKIGVLSDSLGNFNLETYYATDSLQFSFPGYITVRFKVKTDQHILEILFLLLLLCITMFRSKSWMSI